MNGVPVSLPIQKCSIGNVSFGGTPIVDFDCSGIYSEWRQKAYNVKENWIKDNELETYFKGFPPEVVEGLNRCDQYVQLNPKYTIVIQGPKPTYQRYAYPFILSALESLAKKDLIGRYEKAMLNLAIHSFVWVGYGDEKKGMDFESSAEEYGELRDLFAKGMSGFPLVVSSIFAKPQAIKIDVDDLYQYDKYRDVNNDILSAGGVSGILVTGQSEDGSTFASAQVSVQTVTARIDMMRREIEEAMSKINLLIKEELSKERSYNISEVPLFHFVPLDVAGKKALRETAKELWQKGVVSTESMTRLNGFDMDVETKKRERELNEGIDEILTPRATTSSQIVSPSANSDSGDGESNGPGRPEMDDDERNSDPENAIRGKQPKPSNEDGSMPSDTSIS